jgi:hypothetical protein
MSCHRGERMSILPFPSEAMWNSSTKSPVMARSGHGVPPWVEPMTAASEPSPMQERLRPPKQSVMNSRLPKQMVLLGEKTSHNKCSPFATMVSADEGTIRTSRGKACCKSPFLACQLSVFFAPIRYRVAKIVCSYSEVVLRITKHTMVYPSSGPSWR